MSDPVRWSDGGDAPAGVRDLLAAAAPPPPLDGAAMARSAARLAQATATASPAGAGGLILRPRWFALGGAVGIASVALLWSLTRGAPPRARPATTAAPATAQTEPAPVPVNAVASERATEQSGEGVAVQGTAAVAATSATTDTTPAQPTVAAAATSAGDRPTASPSGSPRLVRPVAHAAAAAHAAPQVRAPSEEEEALLERARRDADERPQAALDALRAHASRFPGSTLVEEREFIACRALVRMHRADAARERGEAFLRRYPRGIYTESVRRLLRTL